MKNYTGRHVDTNWFRVSVIVLVCIVAIHFDATCASGGSAATAGPNSTDTIENTNPPAPLLDLSDLFPNPVRRTVLGVAIWQFIVAFLFILLGLILKKISDHFLEKKVVGFLKRTRVDFDHMLVEAGSRPAGALLLMLGFVGACTVLTLPEEPVNMKQFVFSVIKICLIADLTWFIFRLVDVVTEYMARLSARTESALDDQLVPLVRKALKVTVILIGTVTVMNICGINVTGVVAGLGIGGLAIALGLQDTLANLFGSIVIFIDRPFGVGDWIKLGDVEGIVTQVGFRSTRVQTFPQTIVTLPNKIVADSTIDNVSKRPKRRVVQTIGLTYETAPDKMENVVTSIRDLLTGDDGVDQEFILVRFDDFGEFSLNIMVYYFTKAIGFDEHKETKERLNLAIMRTVDDLGLSIAFPTQTLYFEGDIAEQMAGTPKGS